MTISHNRLPDNDLIETESLQSFAIPPYTSSVILCSVCSLGLVFKVNQYKFS